MIAFGQQPAQQLEQQPAPQHEQPPEHQRPMTKLQKQTVVESEPFSIIEKKDSANLKPEKSQNFHLVSFEEFSAFTLKKSESILGSFIIYSISDKLDLHSDMTQILIGVPGFGLKYSIWEHERHKLAVGFYLSYFSSSSLLWGNVSEHFNVLDGTIFKTQISYSQKISDRLILHTHWAKAFDNIEAELSPQGKKALYEAKYPDRDYNQRNGQSEEAQDSNEVVQSVLTGQHTASLQVQSIAGLNTDRFQMTGEFIRNSGNKLMITSRLEHLQLEELKTQVIKLILSQEWIVDQFHLRIGLGPQYMKIKGTDLDGEFLDESTILPSSELVFYWVI